jgi:hypothetical protein
LSFVADIALKAVVITEFAALLIPAAGQWKTPLAIMVSSVFAALQLRSVALSAKIQQIAAAVLGAFGRPDHDRRIRISAAPFRIFLPVLICNADRGSHHPTFAPAGC